MMIGGAPKTIPGLTGLRGIAALWVVVFHLCSSAVAPLVKGYLGVDVFFILSGFVLSHVYADKFQNFTLETYYSFIKARIARIFPLHLIILAFIGLVVIALPSFTDPYPMPHERFGISSFIASMLLIQNWLYWLPTCWNTPAWSLSAEWAAYLAFPVFMILAKPWRSSGAALAVAALSLAAFIVLLIVRGQYTPEAVGTPGMVRMATEFLCGCLLYRAHTLGLGLVPGWADALTLVVFAACILIREATFFSLFCIAWIVLRAGQNEGPIAKVLSTRPVVFLGEISYSIYLVHWIVIQLANWIIPPSALSTPHLIARDVIVITVTLLISYGTYTAIELRARAWGRKVGLKPKIVEANADAL